ncbi:MAG: Crp/Fnr family transcriptional regulator [Marinilabiliales bacterium]|nr:Crp/Fnr family transcriptional regulator [Marinilabiliales bacterium]
MRLPAYIKSMAQLSAESESKIAQAFHRRELQKGELLFRQGEVCHHIFYIEKGLARVFYNTESGKDVTAWFFADNNFFTAHDSFYQHKPAPNNCELLEDSDVYTLTYSEMVAMLNDNHDMAKFAFHTVYLLAKQQAEFINGIKFQSAEERYNALMHHYPNIFQRAKLRHIASFLGITQETLSRIRGGK